MKNIVLLPGLGCDERSFSHQVKTLKNKFNVKVIVCNTCENMKSHVDFVLSHSPEKMILLGHSFGGWIAQWIAIHAPERVSKLILMGTGTGKLTPELNNIFEEMYFSFKNNQRMEFLDKLRPLIIDGTRKDNNDLLDLIKIMQSEFSHEGLLNQVKTDLEGKETTEFLKHIKCDTLLIHGKQDPFYKEEMAVLKTNIAKNKFVEIDHCGHMIPLERPETVSALIERWLGNFTQSL